MSKNTTLLLVLLLLAGILIILKQVIFRGIESKESKTKITEAPVQQFSNSYNILQEEVGYKGKSFNIIGFIVEDPENLHLYTNFSEKLTSDEAMKEYGCRTLISGGLYTKESTPIGLFISEGRQLKSKIQDTFYNGIFSLNYDGDAVISYQVLKDARVALQSGPTLLSDGSILPFENRSSEETRRIVLGITDDERIIFMVFYNDESVFIGPTLSILPNLVLKAGTQIGIKIDDALNLDGGSASVFKTNSLSLSELTPVGSYFCIN